MGSASRSGPARGLGRLAIATCAEVPGLDPEGRLLLERCREAGIDAKPEVWDDPRVAWDGYDAVLLRSTWDYQYKPGAFLSWVGARGERLINRPAIVEWNVSKRYLAVLEGWGFPIVPSQLIAPGERFQLPADSEFVVKPAVSVGSKDTGRYGPGERARASEHVGQLLAADREVLIQPYLASVETVAETALIMLGGSFSHAMRKGPMLELGQEQEQGLFREEQMAPREAEPREIELANNLVERFSTEVAPPTYARVDLLRAAGGEPLILELELIEPSLFLDHNPPAADRLIELLSASPVGQA